MTKRVGKWIRLEQTAFVYFEGIETDPGWLFSNPDAATDMGEGIVALTAAQTLQGSDIQSEGMRRLVAWSSHAPQQITRDQILEALAEDTPFADERLGLLLSQLGLGPTETGAAALSVVDTGRYEWPLVTFRLRMKHRPDERQQSQLDQAFTLWYQWWVHRPTHSSRNITDIEIEDTPDGCEASWKIDFGAADRRSLDALVEQLRSTTASGVPATELVIGS